VNPTELEVSAARYWDQVADRYLEKFRDEMATKPADSARLAAFVHKLPPHALVADVGCGPCAHITRQLANLGAHVVGVDLSEHCLELARREQPGLRFEKGSMQALPFVDKSLDGLVCYYVLHYQAKVELAHVLSEFRRVLKPHGHLMLVVKEGSDEGWIDDPMGTSERVYWSSFELAELIEASHNAGLQVVQTHVRPPQADEMAVPRIYLWATPIPEAVH